MRVIKRFGSLYDICEEHFDVEMWHILYLFEVHSITAYQVVCVLGKLQACWIDSGTKIRHLSLSSLLSLELEQLVLQYFDFFVVKL